MLTRILDHLTKSLFNRLSPTLALLPPALVPVANNISLKDVLDGLVFATPKRRNSIRKILRNRYGSENWKYGQKLWKPKRNIITCMECGSFHEIHTICRACYKKVEEESNKIIESIKNAWGKGVIDKEVQVLYQGESATSTEKRIVELEKPRPLWFVSNLSQKAANPRQIEGPSIQADDRTIRTKQEGETAT